MSWASMLMFTITPQERSSGAQSSALESQVATVVNSHPPGLVGLHVLIVQALLSSQARGVPPAHWPSLVQVVPTQHSLPPLQTLPAAAGTCLQPPGVAGSQLSMVQGLVSPQLGAG